jgi:SWI/SNF-related matrix-associated actin-dependent regulator of chromatin subfamily A3
MLVKPAKQPDNEKFDFDANDSSSKIEALLAILKAARKGSGNKSVIFSQWTSFLDVIEPHLKRNGFKFVRIDGKMAPPLRDAAMESLEKDPEVTILLASLAVCSVGLNLVAANQVILMDSWW